MKICNEKCRFTFIELLVTMSPKAATLAREAAGKVVKSAFTLIELLVVIAIIAILMTILLPALKQAKDRGKQIVCQGNLKQVGVALEMYSNDFNGWFPTTLCGSAGDWHRWPGILMDTGCLPTVSAGDKTALKCPSGKLFKDQYTYSGNAYGMNIEGTSSGFSPVYPTWRRKGSNFESDNGITTWQNSSLTSFPFLADSIGNDSRQSFVIGWSAGYNICLRHAGQANILFGDFHVKGEKQTAILNLGWPSDNITIPSN